MDRQASSGRYGSAGYQATAEAILNGSLNSGAGMPGMPGADRQREVYARRYGTGSPYNQGNRHGDDTSPADRSKPSSRLDEVFGAGFGGSRPYQDSKGGGKTNDFNPTETGEFGSYMITARGRGDYLSALAKPSEAAFRRGREIVISATINGSGPAREGLRTTREYVDMGKIGISVGIAAVGLPFRGAAKYENSKLFEGRSIMRNGRARSARNLKEYIESVNGTMQKMGLETRYSSKMSGSRLSSQARRDKRAIMKAIRKNPDLNLSKKEIKEIKKLFDDLDKAGKNSNMRKGRLRSSTMRLTSSLLRQMQKNDCIATQGLATTIRYLRLGKETAKMGIKLTRKLARVARFLGRKALLAAMIGARKAAESALAKALLAKSRTAKKIAEKTKNAAKKGRKAKKKAGKAIAKIKEISARFLEKLRFINRLKNSRLGRLIALSPIGKAFGILMKVLNMIRKLANLPAEIFALLKKICFAIVTVLIIVSVTISLISSGASAVFAAFSFNGVEEDVRTKMTDKLNELYVDDLEYIAQIPKKYKEIESVESITYADDRDEDEYVKQRESYMGKNKQKKNSEYKFYQSTNCAEILSMTLARFNYNIKKAKYTDQSGIERVGTDAALSYIEELYRASHVIEIRRLAHERESKGLMKPFGPEYYNTAEVTYRTTYFTGMFSLKGVADRQVSFTEDYMVEGASIDEDGDVKLNMYYIMRAKGLSHEQACGVLGNVKAECDFAPDLSQKGLSGPKQGYGLFQLTEGRKEALKKFCRENSQDVASVSGQMAYFFHELGSSEQKAMTELKKAKTTADAAWAFNKYYERSASSKSRDSAGSKKRIRFAEEIDRELSKYKDNWKSIYSSTASGQGIVDGIIQVPYIKQVRSTPITKAGAGGLYDFNTKKYTHTDWPSYSFPNGRTIATSGCGQCSTAMGVSYASGKIIAPSAFSKWYVGAGSDHEIGSKGAAKYGVATKRTANINEVIKALRKGNPVMSLQKQGIFTNGGHFIMIVGYKDGKFAVNDPSSEKRTTRLSNRWYTQKEITQSAAPTSYTIFITKSSVSSSSSTSSATVSGNGKIQKAISWAIKTADDNRNGYSMGNRLKKNSLGGKEYDCSSFVASAWRAAGVKVGFDGTDTCTKTYRANGFKIMTKSQVSLDKLKAGDVLWKNGHIELYIGNGKTIGAHKDYDGKAGDSRGNEISTANAAKKYSKATHIFRPTFK